MSTRWAYVAGFTGGITSTLFGAGGPPYAMYLSHRGLAKEQYRATMGFATLTSISLRTIAFFATGILLDPKVWIYAVAIVPAGLAGLWAAGHLFRRISREILMRAVALMLLASGASLILRALALGGFLAHRDEFLRRGRMDADGGVELRLGGAQLHRDGDALDDFARVGAEHVRADDALAGGVDHQLHEDFFLARCPWCA